MVTIRNDYLKSEPKPAPEEDDDDNDANIRAYLRDLLSTFVTGHDHQDLQTIDKLASEISKFSGQSEVDIKQMMLAMRQEFLQHLEEGVSQKDAILMVESKMYQNGVQAIKLASLGARSISASSVGMAGGAITSASCYAFSAVILTAQTATDYRLV